MSARDLAHVRRMAVARGGRLLSCAFLGDTNQLRFRCSEDHEWTQTAFKLGRGRWCPVCAKARKYVEVKARAHARLQGFVTRHGGTIISPAYKGSGTMLRFRCADGHEFSQLPRNILIGSWCLECAGSSRGGTRKQQALRRQETLRRIELMAKKRGGKLLAPVGGRTMGKVRIRCERGHIWEELPKRVDDIKWCPKCRQESLLALMRRLARERGGACLSAACRKSSDHLQWRCARGHRFEAIASSVSRGRWCSKCRWFPRDSIERMNEIARERGGLCLSRRYVNKSTKLRWRCLEGHVWDAHPSSVLQGSWCPVCRLFGRRFARLSIEDMRATAVERGGECLSATYRGCSVHLGWRCALGHTWRARPMHVRKGSWCPVCAHLVPGTLEGMRALAQERGGRCVTRSWNNHRGPLRFECGRGHRFTVLSVVAKSGVWCPECRPRGQRRMTTPTTP